MPGHTRLCRRNAVYYHRAVVPKDLIATYGKREETFSLKTTDHQQALRLVRVAAVEVDQRFEAHRHKLKLENQPPLADLSDAQIAVVRAAYLHHLLDEDEDVRLDGFEELVQSSAGLVIDGPLSIDPRPSFEERIELVEENDAENRYNIARGRSDVFHRGEAEEVLKWHGIELRLDPKSLAWPKLVRALQSAAIEAAEIIRDRNKGDIAPTPASPVKDAVRVAVVPKLSIAIKSWTDEKSRVSWSPKVQNDHVAWTNMFIEIAGDRPITEYGKSDARAFKEVLLKLPANWQKKPETRRLGVQEAARRAVQMGLEPMSITNANKSLRRVGAFWNWAEANYDGIATNVFKGLTMKQTVVARDQRDPFSPEQLNALFSSPLFVGCRSATLCNTPGAMLMHQTARFWLPVLSLFTGARLNELCQLAASDIQASSDIPFINITNEGEDQKVKTVNGKRRMPIHSQLLELGFLEFVEKRRDEGEQRLFPELQLGADGYYSGDFSKFFSRYLIRIGIKTDKTSFHSFRHSFEDACRAADMSGGLMDALQGHSEGGQKGRYGRGYELERLNSALQTIQYRHVDLTKLPIFVA